MQEYKNIDEYIVLFPEEVQEILKKIRRMVHEIIPNVEEAISYGIPTFRVAGKNVFHFAAYKDHVSVHPVPRAMEEEVSKYRTGKGTLQFNPNNEIPYELIGQVIESLYEERLKTL